MAPDSREETLRLYDEAMRKVHEGAYDDALAIGARLKRSSFSGSFEVLALARAGKEDVPGAIAELREGVAVAPSVWLLWQLLGNHLSDLGRADEALDAYARALDCPRVDTAMVQYNRALALRKAERSAEALAASEAVTDGPCQRPAALVRLSLLNELGRHDDALAAAEAVMATLDEDSDENESQRAHALGERALALLLGRGDRAGAQHAAARAVGDGAFIASAAEVLRRLRTATSRGARGYRMQVEGRWPGSFHGGWPGDGGGDTSNVDDKPIGFVRIVRVVADTPEQALAFARDFEPAEARPSLVILSVDADEPAPDALHGVYWASGHMFFPLGSKRPGEA